MLSTAWFRARSSRVLLRVLCSVAALTGPACSVLVEPNRVQCTTDEDCQTLTPAGVCIEAVCHPDPVWGCLDSVTFPAPTPGAVHTVTMRFRDLVTEEPQLGVNGRLCRKLDVECTQPLSDWLQTDAGGNLVIAVDSGFDGYIELKSEGKVDGLYFLYPPITSDREIPFIPLFFPVVIGQLAQINGKTIEPDRGHILLGAYDCQHKPGEGVKLSTADADEKSSSFYVVNRIPKASAAATDNSGRGGYINLKAGTVTISGMLPVEGVNKTIANVSMLVRPGTITYTQLVPSPR